MKTKIIITLIMLTITAILFIKPFSNKQNPIRPSTLSGFYDYKEKVALFHRKKITVPEPVNEKTDLLADVLGSKSKRGPKRIEVDLTNQKLYAFEGDKKIYDFSISSGKWGATPTGDFVIWTKLRYTLMTGGSPALGTYYYLPNVPFTMFFYGPNAPKAAGYGLHGTYWHNNFGHPMSHGCVNMKTEEAEKIFYWADPVLPNGQSSIYADGTPIRIYGTAPNN